MEVTEEPLATQPGLRYGYGCKQTENGFFRTEETKEHEGKVVIVPSVFRSPGIIARINIQEVMPEWKYLVFC
jgi:hypothetical protein